MSAAPQTRRDPFEALADPTRRGILDLLRRDGVRTAGDIADAFPHISRPAVSRHLRVLRECGMVVAEQVGREWRYQLDSAMLAQTYRDWFERFAPLWEQSLERLKQQAESDEGANDG
jgi:DNA-binding transcriptional ArsR family regulator